jgi:hypothetical protein
VEQRLAEMERRLAQAERRSKMAGAVAVIGIIGALVLMTGRPAVTAGSSPRITSTSTANNGTTLKLPLRVVDPDGKVRLLVEAKERQTLLKLQDGKEQYGVALLCGPDLLGGNNAVVGVFGKGLAMATMSADDGGCRLMMSNNAGHASLTTDQKEGGTLLLSGVGESAAHLVTQPEGAQLRLRDQEGNWVTVPRTR